MSKQKSLMSFFKPVQIKRVFTEVPEDVAKTKKPKLDKCEESAVDDKTKSEEAENTKPETATTPPRSPARKMKDPNLYSESEPMKENLEKSDDIIKKSDSDDKMPDCQFTTKDGCKDSDEKKSDDNSTKILKDATSEDNEKKNEPTTPVRPDPKLITTPFGMLSPLQCLARIKSQCAKTPALHCSIGPTWFFALQGEFNKPYFQKLSQFIVAERKSATIFPPENQVWTWTQLSAFKDVKVVILGQDPYHNPRQAHGLCFSVQKGVPPPPSLINMYKELETDIPGFKAPSHGNLTGWAEQGVLLLNAVLTVRYNQPNSHKDKGWEQLTDAVIKRLSDMGTGIVFLLWGSYAHKKGALVDKKKHHILQAVHPSPLSAHRGFFGCKHFSKCNALLEKSKKKPINWSHLPLV